MPISCYITLLILIAAAVNAAAWTASIVLAGRLLRLPGITFRRAAWGALLLTALGLAGVVVDKALQTLGSGVAVPASIAVGVILFITPVCVVRRVGGAG